MNDNVSFIHIQVFQKYNFIIIIIIIIYLF